MSIDQPRPIRNVYYAIDMILQGKSFDSFKDRIEVREDARSFWVFAMGGASIVTRHAPIDPQKAVEFNKLAHHVEMLP